MPLSYDSSFVRDTAHASFWQRWDSWQSSFGGLVFNTTSNSDQETYPYAAPAPMPQEMLGQIEAKAVPAGSYTIANKKWESTVPIKYEWLKFGRLDVVSSITASLAEKARGHVDYLLSTLLTGNGLGPDGQNFFDTDHSDYGAKYTTSQANAISTNITSNCDNPTDIEWAAAVRGLINASLGFKDAWGDPVFPGQNPSFVLMVPAGYKSIAERVEKVDQLTGPVGNDLKGAYRTIVNPFLTAPTTSAGAFYLFVASSVHKPLITQVAEPVSIDDDIGGDFNFATKDARFSAFWYGNVGYGDWRTAVRQSFT